MATLEELFPELYGSPGQLLRQNRPGFGSSFKSGLATFPVGTGRLIEDFGPEATAGLGRGLRAYGEGVQQRNPQAVQNFGQFLESPGLGIREAAGQALGSTLPALIPYVGAAGRVLGVAGSTIAGAGISAIPSYGGIRQTQDQTGEINLLGAAVGAGAVGAIEQLTGVQRLLRPGKMLGAGVTRQELGEMASTPLRTFGLQTGRVGAGEGFEELLQNPIEQYAGGQNPMEQLDQTAFGGFQGFVGGAATFGLGSGARRAFQQGPARQWAQQQLQDPTGRQFSAQQDALDIEGHFQGNDWRQQQLSGLIRARIQEGAEPFDLVGMQRELDAVGVDNGELPGLVQPTNPYNLGGYVDLADAGEQEINQPQLGLFGGGGDTTQTEQTRITMLPPTQSGSAQGHQVQPSPQATYAEQFKSFGGRVTNVQKELNAAKDKEAATGVVRNWIEKKGIAESTHRALAQMHTTLTGEAYEDYVRKQEAASAIQKQVAGAVDVRQRPGNGQAVAGAHTQVKIAPRKGKKAGQAEAPVDKPLPSPVTVTGANGQQVVLKTEGDVARWKQQNQAADFTSKGATNDVQVQDVRQDARTGQVPDGQAGQAQTGQGQSGDGQPVQKGTVPVNEQSPSSQALRPGNRQAQGAELRSGGSVQAAPDQRAAGTAVQSQPAREVSDSAKRAQVAEAVIKSLPEKDQEILGLIQQHGLNEGIYSIIGQKLGISRQAARTKLIGEVDKVTGKVKVIGILDKISNIAAQKGISLEDLKQAYTPRVYESNEARRGLKPTVQPSELEEGGLSEESAEVQGTGAVASAGASQSEWREDARDNEIIAQLEKTDPKAAEAYKAQIAEQRSRQPRADTGQPEQELVPAAQGEKVDQRIAARDIDSQHFDAARSWWDGEMDGTSPTFDDLADRHQEEVIEAVKDRKADGRLQKRILGEFREGALYAEEGNPFEDTQPLTEGKPYKHAGVLEAHVDFHYAGFTAEFFKLIRPLRVFTTDRTTGGKMDVNEDGTFTVSLSKKLLDREDKTYVSHVLRHEFSHVVDIALGGYSQSDRFAALMPELQKRHTNGGWGGGYLTYPFGSKYGTMPAVRKQAEAFAQVYALWTAQNIGGKSGKVIIRRDFPELGQFLTEVDIDAKTQLRQRTLGVNRPSPADSTARADTGRREALLAEAKREPTYHAGEVERIGGEFATSLKINAADWAKKGLNAVVFASDLADIAVKEGLTSAKRFFDLINTKSATKIKLEAEIDDIMQGSVNVKDREAANAFLQRSTLAKEWGYQPTWKDQVEIDSGLEAQWQRLSPEARKLVDDVFRYGHQTHTQLQGLINKEINDEFDSQLAANPTRAGEIEAERKAHLKLFGRVLPELQGPYAPLKRFGDYVAVAKSQAYADAEANGDRKELDRLVDEGGHYVVKFFDSLGAAEKERSRLEQLGFPVTKAHERQQMHRSVQELPWGAIAKVRTAIGSLEDSTPGKDALVRLMTDVYLKALSESSARKSELRRRGVEGADQDMLRSFVSHGRATAHFMAALQHNKEISGLFQGMQAEANRGTSGEVANRTRVFNEISARYAQSVDYRPTPVADKLMAISTAWMLVTSPAYLIQNATQPFMLTLPVLAGRFGASAAWTELVRAYKDIAKSLRFKGSTIDIDAMPLPEAEKALLSKLRDEGRIDITIAQDLGRWSKAESKLTPGLVGKIARRIWALPHQVEMVNRLTSALAAHRLSGSYEYTARVIDQTHGNYAAANAPRFFNAGGAAKLILQFRKFQLIQVSLIGRLVQQALRGASAEEKAIARRALLFLGAHHMVMAGALGLPAANIVGLGLAAAGGDSDEPLDTERELREMIGDKELADLLLKGVPASLGVDISNRIGMGNAFSLMPFADYSKLLDRKTFGEVALQAMGPFLGGLLPRWAGGAGQIAKGNYYKGLEDMMPKGVLDAMRAYRVATEGVTQRNNDTVMKPDEISLFSVMTQALGMPSTQLTDRQRVQGDLIELQTYYRERTGTMKQKYAKAYRENDLEELKDLREEWQAVAAAMKRNGLKPQPVSELVKAPSEQMKRERNVRHGVETTKANRRLVEQLQ